MYGHTIAADAWKIPSTVHTRIIPLEMNRKTPLKSLHYCVFTDKLEFMKILCIFNFSTNLFSRFNFPNQTLLPQYLRPLAVLQKQVLR